MNTFKIFDLLKILPSTVTRLNTNSLFGFLRHIKNKDVIDKYLPEGAIIVEAGAHKGKDTLEMANRWPESVVHAFEPVPELFIELQKNTKKLRNVKRYQVALSDKNGFFQFHVSEGTSDESGSLLFPKEHLKVHPTVTFNKDIKVKTTTLDSWARENNINKVDFMWLDLQGAEYQVLKKSKIIFPKTKLLYVEANIRESYFETLIYPKFKKWLMSKGMKPVYENIYWKDMGNALFVRS